MYGQSAALLCIIAQGDLKSNPVAVGSPLSSGSRCGPSCRLQDLKVGVTACLRCQGISKHQTAQWQAGLLVHVTFSVHVAL